MWGTIERTPTRSMPLTGTDSARTPERYQMLKAWNSLSKDAQAIESRAMEIYSGMVSNMDYHFGRVMKFLKDIGEYDNTIVIFLRLMKLESKVEFLFTSI